VVSPVSAQTLTLPVPPSSDHRLRPGRNRKGGIQFYNTHAYAKWLEGARRLAMGARLRRIEPPAEVVVTITWYRASLCGDLTNREKPAWCDVLRGLAYRDDSQIAELHLYRFLDRQNPRIEVTIERTPWRTGLLAAVARSLVVLGRQDARSCR